MPEPSRPMGRSLAAALLLLPFFVRQSSESFLTVQEVTPLELPSRQPSRPRLAVPNSDGLCGTLPAVGLAATMGLLAAARAAVQRRYKGTYNLDMRMPAGEETVMTEEEQAEWLETRTAELQELCPMTDEEFQDEVEESTWAWGRHLLPFSDYRREETALHKKKTIMKQREFFKKLRVWHPLALKYPTHLKGLDSSENPTTGENLDWKINVEYLANEEKIAGFTYKDFLEETNGMKFDKAEWAVPQVGDVIEGTIKSLSEEGAFVEIDTHRVKSWAQIPLRFMSLKPIGAVEEVGLELGQKVSAAVVEEGLRSVVPGDKYAVQYILSLQSIELDNAWEKVLASYENEEGAKSLWEVQVLNVASWGASVMTEDGMMGMIPARDLGNKAGDAGLVGATLEVRIVQVRPDMKDNVSPQFVTEYPIIFSYADVQKQEMVKKYSEGAVADAKVVGFAPATVDIEIDGVAFGLPKVDITGAKTQFEVMDLFTTEEMIKVYCINSDVGAGAIRWGIRPLERKPGALLLNKSKVFAEAEETAAAFFKKSQEAKQAMLGRFEDAGFETEVSPLDFLEDKPSQPRVSDIIDDDDTF